MARRQWEGARQIVEKMVEAQGQADPDLLRRLAHIQLGLKNYPGALTAFEQLLESPRVKGEERTEAIKGFLDAAANPTVALGDRERQNAVGIGRQQLAHI